MANRLKWLCLDCKIDTGKALEHYYINLDTWLSVVGSKQGMLCITCVESRLKRKLLPSDFPNVTINSPKYGSKSILLINRLQGNPK